MIKLKGLLHTTEEGVYYMADFLKQVTYHWDDREFVEGSTPDLEEVARSRPFSLSKAIWKFHTLKKLKYSNAFEDDYDKDDNTLRSISAAVGSEILPLVLIDRVEEIQVYIIVCDTYFRTGPPTTWYQTDRSKTIDWISTSICSENSGMLTKILPSICQYYC